MSTMDAARRAATRDCDHPDEYVRLGDHPDVTGRFVPEDINGDDLYCLRCERDILADNPPPLRRRS
ncbi:MAG TPA: hypothetical protein VFX53_04630 [Pedococcus sp.]|nr:hypothetical protein [Pedococcus sp.]